MLNVSVVGSGYWGINYIRVFNELPDSQVVAICDLSRERLSVVEKRWPAVRTFEELSQMLNQVSVDAVVVSTPATTHYEIARQALLLDKHVLVEKPITTRVEDGEELIELAQERNLTLMVGHTFLFNPGIHKVKEWLEQAEFGHVYYLHATRTNLGPIRHDVAVVWDLAPHDVSIFGYLLHKQPDWVSATGAKLLGNSREDVVFITLGYPDNVIGNIHVSWADPNKVREVVVVGSNRRIVFDDLNSMEPVKIFEKGVVTLETDVDTFGEFRLLVRDGDIISPKVKASEPLKNQCAHFVQCVESGAKPLTDGRNGVDVIRVLEAVQKSMEINGVPVEVNP